jgi:hypothetical protein
MRISHHETISMSVIDAIPPHMQGWFTIISVKHTPG